MNNSMGSKITFINSMRGKLILFFLGLSLIPLIIVSIFAFLQSQNALSAKTTEELQEAATNNAATLKIGWKVGKKIFLLWEAMPESNPWIPMAQKLPLTSFTQGGAAMKLCL